MRCLFGHAILQGFKPIQRLTARGLAEFSGSGAKAMDAFRPPEDGKPWATCSGGTSRLMDIFHGLPLPQSGRTVWQWLVGLACGVSHVRVLGGWRGLEKKLPFALRCWRRSRRARLARSFLRGGHDSRILRPIMRKTAPDSSTCFSPPLLPQFRQRLSLFPVGDSRVRQAWRVWNFQIVLPLCSSTQIAADDIARGSHAGSGTQAAVAAELSRLERIGVVMDVVDDEAGARQCVRRDGHEIDQKSRGASDGRLARRSAR